MTDSLKLHDTKLCPKELRVKSTRKIILSFDLLFNCHDYMLIYNKITEILDIIIFIVEYKY